MRHFLISPLLFAAWFAVGQFGLIALNCLSFYVTMRLISSDVYFYIPSFSELPLFLVVRAGVVGAITGIIFATFVTFHRKDTRFDETLLGLLGHLLKGGAIAVGLVLLYYGAFNIPVQLHLAHIPYPTYTPYRAISSWGNFVPPLLLLLSVLWAMRRTLKHPQMSNS